MIYRQLVLILIFCMDVGSLSAKPRHSSKSDWDAIIRNAIIRELGSLDSGDAQAIIYVSRRYDLNGDGNAELLIWVPTSKYGGTSGYPLLIYRMKGKRPILLARIEQVWTPLIISRTSKYGWRDVVMQMGGGGVPMRYAMFRHNRETYSDWPNLIKATSIRGQQIITKEWRSSTFGPVPLKNLKRAPNKRLERTRHERASLLSCVGEPLKRTVRCLL